MWIQYTRTHPDGTPVLRGLKLPWMAEAVEFNANGKANVPEDVGQRLVEERPDIEPSGGTDSSDSDSADDGADAEDSDDEDTEDE